MIDILIDIKEAWDAGGVFIYPIHVVAILSISITIERIYFLYVKSSINIKSFLNQLIPVVQRKDFQGALQVCDAIKAPAARLAKAQILRAMSTRSDRDDIEATIETAMAKESHPIERRTPYLSLLANIATLLGLLGTISGLISSFAAAAKIDPTQKAELLAKGISEAMNATAYGLIVAILSLVCFAFLQGKTQSIIDEMKETAFDLRSVLPYSSEKGAA